MHGNRIGGDSQLVSLLLTFKQETPHFLKDCRRQGQQLKVRSIKPKLPAIILISNRRRNLKVRSRAAAGPQ
ncbi:MAG: hypothetical protein ACP5M4_07860 [Acidobacteriaceae bacterium]